MRKESAYNTDLFLLYLQTGSREQRLAQRPSCRGKNILPHENMMGAVHVYRFFALFGNKQCFFMENPG